MTCQLGDPDAVTLTPKQFHGLQRRVAAAPDSPLDGELTEQFLCSLGLPRPAARRILQLLARDDLLDRYLDAMHRLNITVLTRLSPLYPRILEERLGSSAPAALFFKGDLRLLSGPWISLVGSRRLESRGRAFAERVGSLAFLEGYVLVSGGAEGADRAAQNACLAQGGDVLIFTPDRLSDKALEEHVLFCSEDGFELDFSPSRALSRNRLIHALGEKTFVAQCNYERGGTWRGSLENLKNGYSPLFLIRDGSRGADELLKLGAHELFELNSISALCGEQICFES